MKSLKSKCDFNFSWNIMVLILLFSSCFTVRNTDRFSYEKLNPETYRQMLRDSNGYYLIDVRTAGEYRKSHITGAVNCSYFNFHFGKDVDSISRDALIFVYCQTCHRSPLASKILKRKGFRKVYDMKGGYQNWK